MNNNIKTTLLGIFALSSALYSCNKNPKISLSNTGYLATKHVRSEDRIAYFDGNIVPISSFNWDDNLIAFDRGSSQPLYVFSNQEKFTAWVLTQPEAEVVLTKNAKLLALRKFVVDNNIEQITESTGIIPQNFIDYMRANIDPNWSDPRDNDVEIVGNPIGWSLHDNINQGGSWKIGIANNPNYNWFNFNNRASSLGGVYAGVMALCDKTWYWGTYFWIVSGPPFTLSTSFSQLTFNDRASSNL
jgi:hypothetical protein